MDHARNQEASRLDVLSVRWSRAHLPITARSFHRHVGGAFTFRILRAPQQGYISTGNRPSCYLKWNGRRERGLFLCSVIVPFLNPEPQNGIV